MKNYIITQNKLFFNQDTDGFSPSILDATLFEKDDADKLALSLNNAQSEIITTYLSRQDLKPLAEKLDALKMAVFSVPLSPTEKQKQLDALRAFFDNIPPVEPNPHAPKDITIAGLLFKLTCSACPEQYDVYEKDSKIGYVRLRHGSLSLDNEVSEYTIWQTNSVDGDGDFTNQERPYFLAKLAFLLLKEFNILDTHTTPSDFDSDFSFIGRTSVKPLQWIDEADYHFSHCLIGDFFIKPIQERFWVGFYKDDYLTQEYTLESLQHAKNWANEHYLNSLEKLLC